MLARNLGGAVLAAFLVCASGGTRSLFAAQSAAATTPSDAQLTVTGNVQKPLSLSADDLAHMPRTTIKVTSEHDGKEESYEGVLVSDLLKQAGVPQGSKLNGKALATYVEASASDGYRVVFSLAELDSDFANAGVLVADKMDGQPMGEKLGPLRLVVPHDKRPARWVRMLRSIKVTTVAD